MNFEPLTPNQMPEQRRAPVGVFISQAEGSLLPDALEIADHSAKFNQSSI